MTDGRATILVYDVDWGRHRGGVAINTCVIPLLPQSVNRAGVRGRGAMIGM